MLFCEVCETSKNTYFEEHLQATASGGVLSINHRMKVAGDMCYVKKVLLVVDRAVKVTFFYNDKYLL